MTLCTYERAYICPPLPTPLGYGPPSNCCGWIICEIYLKRKILCTTCLQLNQPQRTRKKNINYIMLFCLVVVLWCNSTEWGSHVETYDVRRERVGHGRSKAREREGWAKRGTYIGDGCCESTVLQSFGHCKANAEQHEEVGVRCWRVQVPRRFLSEKTGSRTTCKLSIVSLLFV